MKKIVALVLCLVLALSLATVAMAADTYTAFGGDGEKLQYSVTYNKAVKAEYDDDGVNTVPGNVANWVVNGNIYVETDKDPDIYVKKNDSSKKILLVQVDTAAYWYSAKKFTNVGEKCGQLDEDTDGTYYTFEADGVDYYYAAGEGGTYVLVGGKLVEVLNADLATSIVAHDWKGDKVDEDDVYTTVVCKDCGVAGLLVKNSISIPAGYEEYTLSDFDGEMVAIKTGATSGSTTVESAKTFDAGIALYAGMALASVAGSAVVIGKKKEF